jgi:hypothetical protein
MPNTYTLLETITVGAAGAASVTFNSIPQTGYSDLVMKISARSSAAVISSGSFVQINSITSGYSSRNLYGDGANAASNTNPYSITSKLWVGSINGASSTASTFSNGEVCFTNYTSSNNKSASVDGVIPHNGTPTYANLAASLLSNTAAISSLTLSLDSGTFAQHSTFSLYGVSALGTTPTKAPKATGGSIIQTDGTYWYHAFLSSGTFTPATALSCDVLVVAGGGGGGNSQQYYAGGGGGAGGVLAFASQSITTSGQTVTVGAGGAAETNGSNSQFASLTASVGGGLGRNFSLGSGTTGGSGGANSGAATSGQGNAAGTTTGGNGAAGGGGAGAAGSNATANPNGGAGGAGTTSVTNWGALTTALSTTGLGVSNYIAGGGGGGGSPSYGSPTVAAGGSGGGGAGGINIAGTGQVAGTANTGGGGGGASNGANGTGATGGSGLVIIRYLAA